MVISHEFNLIPIALKIMLKVSDDNEFNILSTSINEFATTKSL